MKSSHGLLKYLLTGNDKAEKRIENILFSCCVNVIFLFFITTRG